MFAAFLSEDMTYSCPIWSPVSDTRSAHEALEDAQERKLQEFIRQAKIKESDHVLEIGTGWGSFAISAVRSRNCKVTSLTLSKEQKALAEQRIAAAGLSDRVKVLLCDYRALPTPDNGWYDKIISIEMLEAVGREYLDTYFECINRLLKPRGGIAVFQCITMPENRYKAYASGEDFIRKYIFPGGHLPTVSQLIGSINRGSKGTLVPDALLNIGGHYAKTLRLWREKFDRNFNSKIRPALLEEHGGMTEKDIELFRRKWQVRQKPYPSVIALLLMLLSITSLIVRQASGPRLWVTLSSRLGAKERRRCWKTFPYDRVALFFLLGKHSKRTDRSSIQAQAHEHPPGNP